MTVAHCRHHALAIALQPIERWRDEIALIPDTCIQSDCTSFLNCREVNATYLRVQYLVHQRLQRIKAEKALREGKLL